jgi:hypothetical protein
MALALKDRVKETTIVVGTGSATLLGSSIGFQPFSVVGNGNTTYYCISDQFGSNWEVGIGTYSSSGNTLARTTVLASSNGGALVVFTAGVKDVFVTYPAEKGVWLDASNNAIGLGTPAAFVGTNITGTASGLTAGNVTTNANLTGAVTSTGNATSLGSFTSLQLATALTDETGSGAAVFATSPTLADPTYTGTLTGSTGILNIGSGQLYKDASGNVGIGTTAPSTKLTVAGEITITGANALRGLYGAGAIVTNFVAGDGALISNTTGASNTAIGRYVLLSNTTGLENTAIGASALQNNTTGTENTAIGAAALTGNTTGSQNTAIGRWALLSSSTGSFNTAIGVNSLLYNTTGTFNVGLGAGTTASSTTVSNEVSIYNGSVTARFQGAASAWSFVSDARDKTDVEPLTLGLEFITGLQPRKFKWDIRDCEVDKGKEASGFIAQEVLEVVEVCNAGYTGLVDTNNPEQYTIATGNLIPVLVNAIKELTARLELLEGK